MPKKAKHQQFTVKQIQMQVGFPASASQLPEDIIRFANGGLGTSRPTYKVDQLSLMHQDVSAQGPSSSMG